MRRGRAAVILSLLALPVLVFVGAGAWALWRSGTYFWIWWLLPVCWGIAFVLSRRWQTDLVPIFDTPQESPIHWTPQDREASKIVHAAQERVREIDPQQLTNPHFYLQTAMDLALEIARHYHPKAADPLSSLTVPEILAAAQLAIEDVATWVNEHVPGGHLLTVKQWRSLSRVPDWYSTFSNVTWALAVLVNPANVGRYFMSKYTLDPISAQMQATILAKFYIVFVRHVGFYVIEMNSGRLRGGADRFRSAMSRLESPAPSSPPADAPRSPAPEATAEESEVDIPAADVTIAVVGQVKAGKSSLVNALLGEQRAAVDVLPLTKEVQRYRLNLPGREARLDLLDTAGYSDSGATPEQLQETILAFQGADLVLLVMDVTSPARDPDLRLLNQVFDWFATNVRFKPPPVIGVLTHIDSLSPVMEWAPPYNWQSPERPKEINIRDAVDYNAREFGALLAGVIPVCTDLPRARVWGINESLLPAMASLLGEARACGLVRNLHADWDRNRFRRLFQQLRNAGRVLVELTTHGVPSGRSG